MAVSKVVFVLFCIFFALQEAIAAEQCYTALYVFHYESREPIVGGWETNITNCDNSTTSCCSLVRYEPNEHPGLIANVYGCCKASACEFFAGHPQEGFVECTECTTNLCNVVSKDPPTYRQPNDKSSESPKSSESSQSANKGFRFTLAPLLIILSLYYSFKYLFEEN